MATLIANISATDKLIRVSGATLTEPRLRFRLDDELIDLYGWDRKQLSGGYRDAGLDKTRWFVTRGVGGTTPASHSAGAILLAATSALISGDDTETSPLPFAGEGGGVIAVTGTEGGSVAAATALELQGTVTDEGGGVAGYVPLGGEQTISLLGPFNLDFDTPGIGFEEDGALVTELSAGALLLQIGVIVTTGFNGSDGHVMFYLGGPNYAAPNDDYQNVTPPIVVGGTLNGAGYRIGAGSAFATTPNVSLWSASFGILSADGAVVAQLLDGDATAGSMDVYVLIAEPAA